MLFRGSIVNARAGLRTNVIINRGIIVEPDCVLGDHGHVGTRARLAGGIRVGGGAAEKMTTRHLHRSPGRDQQ